jgi:hypothetical protein
MTIKRQGAGGYNPPDHTAHISASYIYDISNTC